MFDADGLSPPVLIAGVFEDSALAELAARCCASAWDLDLAHGYGILPTLAAGNAREHAAKDPHYKSVWIDGELVAVNGAAVSDSELSNATDPIHVSET